MCVFLWVRLFLCALCIFLVCACICLYLYLFVCAYLFPCLFARAFKICVKLHWHVSITIVKRDLGFCLNEDFIRLPGSHQCFSPKTFIFNSFHRISWTISASMYHFFLSIRFSACLFLYNLIGFNAQKTLRFASIILMNINEIIKRYVL